MIKRVITNKKANAIKNIKTSFLNGLTAGQIENYIDNQITDLTSAKEFLKKLSKIVLYLAKHSGLQ